VIVKESFRRGPELGRELRSLPAAIYNRTRLLLQRSGQDCVFVPIRSMQYQAVVDAEEIIFVDGIGPRLIELAWREFRPQRRDALDEPVPYQQVRYHPRASETLLRLQVEFAAALSQTAQRLGLNEPDSAPAEIIPLHRSGGEA
jgi:mRNA-degrading endonuclease RelE of RelBE toxin-antitoxin system